MGAEKDWGRRHGGRPAVESVHCGVFCPSVPCWELPEDQVRARGDLLVVKGTVVHFSINHFRQKWGSRTRDAQRRRLSLGFPSVQPRVHHGRESLKTDTVACYYAMMRLPTAGRVTVSDISRHSGKESDEKMTTRGSPPPDADAPPSSLLHLDEFATVATPHTAAPFTADKKAARALGTGAKSVTAVATAPADHSMTVETLARGKEADQFEDGGVEVLPALPASPASPASPGGRCEATVELTGTEAEGLLMLLAERPKPKDEVEGLLMLGRGPLPVLGPLPSSDKAAQEPASTSHTATEAAVYSLLDLRHPARLQPRPAPRAVPAPRPPPKITPKRSQGGGGIVKRRGIGDLATQFTCRHPGCGKAYGCPDAVRKHCRKVHADWLRERTSLGPQGYCSWEPGV